MIDLFLSISFNIVVSYISLAIIVGFIISFFIYYVRLLKSLKSRFNGIYSIINDVDIEQTLEKDKNISSLYSQYKLHLSDFQGHFKSVFLSEEWYNRHSILKCLHINEKQIHSASGMLVGLGVFGTFVGLTIGVCGFDSNTTQGIHNSIKVLLGGMSTAFFTSLLGMSASLRFIWLEKRSLNIMDNNIEKICSFLDMKYYISQSEIISSYLSFKNEEGQTVYIGNAIRDIYSDLHDGTGKVGTLVDDLSNTLDERLSSNLKDNVLPLITNLSKLISDKMDTLSSSLKSPAEDMTKSVVEELKSSMEEMMTKFSSDLSGSTKDSLTALSNNLSIASSSLMDLPNKMDVMTNQLGNAFGGIHTTIEELQGAVKSIVENSATANNDMLSKANQQYAMMNETHNQISTHTDTLISNFDDMVNTLTETTSQINGSLSQFKETKEALGGLVVSLKGVTNNLDVSTTRFKNSQSDYVSGLKIIQDKSSQTVSNIAQALDESKNTLKDYSDRFSVIQQGLTDIFNNIQKGLHQYSTTVSSETQNILNNYSSSINDGVKGLQQAITSLQDFVGELTDSIDKFNEKRK